MTQSNLQLSDLIHKIDDEIYIVCGRVVKIRPGTLDMLKSDDQRTIVGFTKQIWDSPDAAGERPFGSKTCHYYMRMADGGLHVTPFYMGDIEEDMLRKIADVIHSLREAKGV